MENEEFLAHIMRLYDKADEVTKEFQMEGIFRGRRHTISSMAEDAVAMFLKQRLNDPSLVFWIDYCLSFTAPVSNAPSTLFPDIAIVRQKGHVNEVLAIVDVKMDMGFKRDDYPKEMPGIANKIRALKESKRVIRMEKKGKDWKDVDEVLISPALVQTFAVLSDKNMGPAKFQAIRDAVVGVHIDEHGNHLPRTLELYAFTSGRYLGYAKREHIKLNDPEIDSFIADLRTQTNK